MLKVKVKFIIHYNLEGQEVRKIWDNIKNKKSIFYEIKKLSVAWYMRCVPLFLHSAPAESTGWVIKSIVITCVNMVQLLSFAIFYITLHYKALHSRIALQSHDDEHFQSSRKSAVNVPKAAHFIKRKINKPITSHRLSSTIQFRSWCLVVLGFVTRMDGSYLHCKLCNLQYINV